MSYKQRYYNNRLEIIKGAVPVSLEAADVM